MTANTAKIIKRSCLPAFGYGLDVFRRCGKSSSHRSQFRDAVPIHLKCPIATTRIQHVNPVFRITKIGVYEHAPVRRRSTSIELGH